MEPDGVDWLARKDGGVIDFRLVLDPVIIPHDILSERRGIYLEQYRNHMKQNRRVRQHYPAERWQGLFGFVSGEE